MEHIEQILFHKFYYIFNGIVKWEIIFCKKFGNCTLRNKQKENLAWSLFWVCFEHFYFFQWISNCLQRTSN